MRAFFILLGVGSLLFSHEEEYITQKTFEKVADQSFYLSFRLQPEEIQENEIVHVTGAIPQFFIKHHPLIPSSYILVSQAFAQGIGEKYISFLQDEKLKAWFSQNIEFTHPKMHLIPLGVYDNGERIETLDRCRKKTSQFSKKFLLYMNFSVGTCSEERGPVYALFREKPYCYTCSPKPYEEYLEDLASSQFVLSPRGMGLDCFRTWESLYMGAIPIVKSSPIDPLFEDLPVLIVKEWEEITEEFLFQKYEEMQTIEYCWEKLTPQYWIELIRSFR